MTDDIESAARAPAESGVTGPQTVPPVKPAAELVLVSPGAGIESIPERFDSLASDSPPAQLRALAQFGSSVLQYFERGINDAVARSDTANAEISKLREQIADLRVKNAELSAKLASSRRERLSAKSLITFGISLIGFGWHLVESSQQAGAGIGLMVLGVAMTGFGWYLGPRGNGR